MDFSLDDSQSVLQDSARAFLAQHFPLSALQALAVDAPTPDLWAELAALGWAGLGVPETFGGVGGNTLDACLLVEQLGYACVPCPYIHSAVVSTAVLLEFANADQKSQWLPSLASGEKRMAIALAESTGEFSPSSIHSTIDADGYLHGEKCFAKDVAHADAVIVVAREGDAWSAVIVPREACKATPMDTLSGEQLFGLSFAGVPIDAEQRLGASGEGAGVLAVANASGALARAAELVGLAQRVLDICVEHISVREQSGQPIGAFQALQHSSADMLRDVEASRALVYRAACTVGQSPPGTGAENGIDASVAMAKAYASTAALDVVRRGHQLMGAIGYCEEHPLHILHKRIQAAAVDFGDAAGHLDTIADSLGLVRDPIT
jgi:alkylation response protein AidB-like acyl-CoA dehydrogenase